MLTREGKKSAIIHSAVFVVWVALVVLASFKDLEISHVLTKSGAFGEWFGAIFADIGQWPAYLIAPFASCVFFYNVENMSKKKGGYITLKIVFALLHVLGWFLFFSGLERYDASIGIYKMDKLLSLTYAVIVSVPCLYFAKFVDRKLMHRLLKFAVFTVIVLLVTQILTNVTKVFWSRARYRDMIAHGNAFDMFTPWYHPNGIREVEGYKLTSFPSGHVNSATNLFVIVVLADVLPALKDKKNVLYISTSTFVVLTMVSRVMFKAHFLSDTLFAFMISYLAFYIIKAIFFRGGKYVYNTKSDVEGGIEEIATDASNIVEDMVNTMDTLNEITEGIKEVIKLQANMPKAPVVEDDNVKAELLESEDIVLDDVAPSHDEVEEEIQDEVIDEGQDVLDYMTKDEDEK